MLIELKRLVRHHQMDRSQNPALAPQFSKSQKNLSAGKNEDESEVTAVSTNKTPTLARPQ